MNEEKGSQATSDPDPETVRGIPSFIWGHVIGALLLALSSGTFLNLPAMMTFNSAMGSRCVGERPCLLAMARRPRAWLAALADERRYRRLARERQSDHPIFTHVLCCLFPWSSVLVAPLGSFGS